MVSNPTQEYNDFIRANLPPGITYDSVRARYVTVNGKYFATYLEAKWYLDYIVKFGYIIPLPSLFANGEQGAWYDPSDLTTLYQDDAGTTPVTDDGDPVGLMLDKSQGLVLGPELVTNGTFDTDLSGWSDYRVGPLSWDDGTLYTERPDENSGGPYQSIPVSQNTWHILECIISNVTGTREISVWADGTFPTSKIAGATTSSDNTISLVFNSGSNNSVFIYLQGADPSSGNYDNISLKEFPGNHATQSVADARPVYRTDGTLSWLAFDGVDDWFETLSVDLTGTGEVFVVAAGRKEKAAGSLGPIVLNADNGNEDGAFALYAPHNASNREFAWSIAGADQHFLAVDGAEYENPVDYVMTMQGDVTKSTPSTAIDPRWNGQDQSSFSVNINGKAGVNFLNETFRIGRQVEKGNYYKGRISGIVVVGRKATQNEISETEKYLANKSGVTL